MTPERKQYVAHIEVRTRGSIGSFYITPYYVFADSQAHAVTIATARAHKEGYETRFPSHVDLVTP